MAFNFGQGANTGGFSFGATPSTATSGSIFNQNSVFGGTKTMGSGFTFGSTSTAGSTAAPAFSFGGSTTTSTAGGGFSFPPQSSQSGGFVFGTPSTQSAGGSVFGSASTFGTPAGQTTGTGGLFSFKTPGTSAPSTLGTGTQPFAPITSSGTGGFSFRNFSAAGASKPASTANPTATTVTSGFTFGATPFQAVSTSGSAFGGFGTSTATPFGVGKSSTPSTGGFTAKATLFQPSASIGQTGGTSIFGKPTSSVAANTVSGSTAQPSFGSVSSNAQSTGAPTLAAFGSPAPPSTAPMKPAAVFGAPKPTIGGATLGFGFQSTPSASANTTAGIPSISLFQPNKPAAPTVPSSAVPQKLEVPTAALTSSAEVTTATSTSFSLGNFGLKTTAAAPLTLGSTAVSTGTSSGSTLGTFSSLGDIKPQATSVSLVPASSISFGGINLQTTASSGAPTVASTTESAFKPTTAATLQATSKGPAPTTDSSQTTSEKLTYKQLEDIVNKWIQELEEQERVFLNQASQVNTWDRLLIENGEKITELHDEVERVKADQKRLDRELDFILSQQQELEDILKPLEDNIKKQENVQYMQHADIERERTYKLAENIDVELKRMVEDLREIIEHVNSLNVTHRDKESPMAQIVKILNAHMDALQWVDQNSGLLGRRVEEVARLMETRRRDHEKTMKLSFD